MIPVVFINCRRFPFVRQIMSFDKPIETRTRNMLRAVVGRPVLVAETGNGRPVVQCMAVFGQPLAVRSREEWERYRALACIPSGSAYDWQPDTKVKYLYPVTYVRQVTSFTPPEGIRHGRVWMEFDERKGY